jgi:flagellar basal body-associated protein FliL
MLTKEEQAFIDFWRVQRTQKGKKGRNVGFSLGVLIVLLIFFSVITGWHQRAMMALRNDYSTILVIGLAAVAIVVFMSVFSSRYQWEQREQRYNELLAKQRAAAKQKNDQTF